MPDEPVSRRGLLSLSWTRPRRPDLAAYVAAHRDRWAAAGPLLDALAPLAGTLCDVAGAASGLELLDVAAGPGAVASEAARRGAIVTACDPATSVVAAGWERTDASGLDVLWEPADLDALPFEDDGFDAVVSLYGAAFAPRARRTARELLRVLRPGGLLVLAAPAPGSFLAAGLELSRPWPEGVASPVRWGEEDVALDRLDAVAPGAGVETREAPFTLGFESEAQAWAACAVPLRLPERARDAFADLVSVRSEVLRDVRISERATLVLARREL